MKQLRPYQRRALKWCLDHRGSLLCLGMGTGKTCIASTAICHWLALNPEWNRVLLVVTASIKANWLLEFEEWREVFLRDAIMDLPHVRDATIGIVDSSAFPETTISIINYDLLSRPDFDHVLYGEPWDIVVLDESTAIKNHATIRAKCVKKLKARRKICMTGTPILNGKPIELWTQLNWLDPQNWGNWKYFTDRYCDAKPGFGRSIDVSGSSNPQELHRRLNETVMFRISKEEALHDLPPLMQQLLVLPPPESAKPLIDQETKLWDMREEAKRRLREERKKAAITKDDAAYQVEAAKLRDTFTAAMSALSRIRKELGIAKLPLASQHIQDALDSGVEKIVVAAHHKAVLGGIADKFQGYGCLLITGETEVIDRQEIVEKFKTDPAARIIAISIKAAGIGVNGLQVASLMVMVESDWSPGWNQQVQSRIHRSGQQNSVLIQHLVFDKSLDCRMVKRCIEKQSVFGQVIEGQGDSAPAARIDKTDHKSLGSLMTDTERRAAQRAVRHLCKIDADKASLPAGSGLSIAHSSTAHKLAAITAPSPAQCSFMRELGLKYSSQLPPDLRIILSQASTGIGMPVKTT